VSDAPASESPTYCGRCGKAESEGTHQGCRIALILEPPRYCASCQRRLVVQVMPTGWTAHCSAHGQIL
jgi:hypothetical protein